MEQRKIKLTGHRRFHLTNSKKHQPIANLSGDGEPNTHVNLDRAKLWDKVAASYGQPELEQQMWGAEPGQASTMEKLVRQQLPEATPEQVQAALSQLKANPDDAQNFFLQSTGNTPAMDARQNAGGHAGTQVANESGGLKGTLADIATQVLTRGRGVVHGAGNAVLPGAAFVAAGGTRDTPAGDQSLSGEQLAARDQFQTGSSSDVLSQMGKERVDAANGVPGAAERMQELAQKLQGSLTPGAPAEARAKANLDPIRDQQLQNSITGAISNGALLSAGAKVPMVSGALGLKNIADEMRQGADPSTVLQHTGETAATYAGGRAVASDMARAAEAAAPKAAPAASAVGRLGQNAAAVVRGFTAPSTGESAGTTFMRGIKATKPLAPMAAEEAALAARSAGTLGMAGMAARRLGIVGLVGGAAHTLGQGLNRTFSEAGQKEYEDMVRAQIESNGDRSTLGMIGDTAKAIGSASLGDGDHLSTVMASGMGGQDYRDSVHQDAEASDVRMRAKNEHYGAFAQMFPGVDPATLNQWADKAAERSEADYRLFTVNGKPMTVGPSSFEKRLYDPKDPTYAGLSDQQRETYKDLAHRLGGQVAEGFVNDPEVSQMLAQAPAAPRYESKHVAYTPVQTDLAGNQAKSLAARQQQLASGVAHQAPPAAAQPAPVVAQAPVAAPKPPEAPEAPAAPEAPVAKDAPKIEVPPPPKPSTGTAPIGQPFSPARGT